MLDYYVDFYKIGKTCSGFKQRKSFIKNGGFFPVKHVLMMQINQIKIISKIKQYILRYPKYPLKQEMTRIGLKVNGQIQVIYIEEQTININIIKLKHLFFVF